MSINNDNIVSGINHSSTLSNKLEGDCKIIKNPELPFIPKIKHKNFTSF